MKNKKLGIIAFLALIMVSLLIISCGGTKISGTFCYDDDMDNYFITFKGKNFVGTYAGDDFAGTFSVIDNKLILDTRGDTFVIKIIDKNTLEDPQGDIWKKRK